MFGSMIIGIAIGVALTLLATRLVSILKWYDYVLVALGIVFGFLAVQNFVASFQELEPRAAWFTFASFGIPALIFFGIEAFRVYRADKGAAA